MEPRGTALLTDEIPAPRAVTAIIPRAEVAGALQDPDATPELYLDLVYGEEQSTVGISWSHDELERLFARAGGDDIVLTFDRDELQSLFDDVEAHGLRERALIFTVALAGALGSGAAIANAAPTIERGSDGAASVATVQSLATDSIATTGGITSNAHTPGLQTGDAAATASTPSASVKASAKVADDGILSNVRTPGLQTGDEASTAPSASVRVAHSTAADSGVLSNVRTPGLQTGDEGIPAASASIKLSTEPRAAVADDGVLSNVHRPGVQVGPGESTSVAPSVQVSTGSSSGEFLGIDTRDAADALIAGGVLLAIAGATFAGTRRSGTARPA